MKAPKLRKDWRGHYVRTLALIVTPAARIPINTICEVEGFYQKLTLRTKPCCDCGVSLRVAVEPHLVEYVGATL